MGTMGTMTPIRTRYLLPKIIESEKVRTVPTQLAIIHEKLIAGMDNSLFVSKYRLELLKKE